MKYDRLSRVVNAVAGAVLLAGAQAASAAPVGVQVVSGTVQVGARSVAFTRAAPSVTWQLGTPGYSFTNSSIDFGANAALFSCVVASGGQSITCTMGSRTVPRGNYTASAQASSGPAPHDSSPSVWTSSD